MKNINLKWTISFIAVIGLLIFLHFTGIISPLERYVYSILNKASAKFYSLSTPIRTTYEDQTSKINLLEINRNLDKKVQELIVENSRLKKLEEENSKLRQHLRFFKENEDKYVLANVISRQISINSEENQVDIIIDKGRAHGLKIGLPVIDDGVIMGKISKIEEGVSHITLITNSNCKLAATMQNSSRTSGVVEGNLGLTIGMNFIPQVEEIEAGDLVVTSGLEEDIPRGILIGEVITVNDDSNEIWKSAIIEPVADFDDLIIVAVLLPQIVEK